MLKLAGGMPDCAQREPSDEHTHPCLAPDGAGLRGIGQRVFGLRDGLSCATRVLPYWRKLPSPENTIS